MNCDAPARKATAEELKHVTLVATNDMCRRVLSGCLT
jgi:hypothetical protein